MPSYTIGAGELAARYRTDHADRHKRIVNALHKSALQGEAIVAQDTPVDTARTKNAWHVVRLPDGADLLNDSPVAVILEVGSRPHWPPFLPILQWAARKFGTAGGKRSFESLSEVDPGLYAIAKGVQKKIAEEGTEPHWMVKKNLPRLRAIAKRNIEQALK